MRSTLASTCCGPRSGTASDGRLILLLSLVLGCSAWTGGAPELPTGRVGRPWYRIGDEAYQSAGQATLLEVGGRRLVVTALSNFGSEGGLDPAWSAEEALRRVEVGGLSDFDAQTVFALSAGGLLALPPAPSAVDDVVAFEVSAGPALQLSPAPLGVGDALWLAAELGEAPGLRLAAARVTGVEGAAVTVELRTAEPLEGSAGAPLLDAEGRVRGLMTGSTVDEGAPGRLRAASAVALLPRLTNLR
jgi:hypothetical protein